MCHLYAESQFKQLIISKGYSTYVAECIYISGDKKMFKMPNSCDLDVYSRRITEGFTEPNSIFEIKKLVTIPNKSCYAIVMSNHKLIQVVFSKKSSPFFIWVPTLEDLMFHLKYRDYNFHKLIINDICDNINEDSCSIAEKHINLRLNNNMYANENILDVSIINLFSDTYKNDYDYLVDARVYYAVIREHMELDAKKYCGPNQLGKEMFRQAYNDLENSNFDLAHWRFKYSLRHRKMSKSPELIAYNDYWLDVFDLDGAIATWENERYEAVEDYYENYFMYED